ncbi:MAG: VCBS repeat-containing protein, partial [Bacteroidetes bacterium]
EDVDCACFDANGDGTPDLYVASGGNELPLSSTALRDRLYLNDGRAGLRKAEASILDVGLRSTGTVRAADFDGDGDQDLFVGTRLEPFAIGMPGDGLLLQNDGRGQFTDITDSHAPELRALGMITDAAWVDLDGDRDIDLVVAGEWMPLTIFENKGGRLSRKSAGLDQSHGWWLSLSVADLDGDGDQDLIAGNLGLNTRFKVSPERPARMYVGDFDRNRTLEQLITLYEEDEAYPLVLRPDLVMQMPGLKRKYLKHANYREQTIEDILEPDALAAARVLTVYHGQSAVAYNDGAGHFALSPLPLEAQLSPVWASLPVDLDADGHQDLVLGGNLMEAKPETGLYAGSYGLILRGGARGGWQVQKDAIRLQGAVRGLAWLPTRQGTGLVVARNDASLQWLPLRPVRPGKPVP